jgi:hypothetical protein
VLTSCADSKTFVDNKGTEFTAQPYGWANYESLKYDTVVYEPCIGNIVCSAIFSETVVVPVWLTGWQIMEPVALKGPRQGPQ